MKHKSRETLLGGERAGAGGPSFVSRQTRRDRAAELGMSSTYLMAIEAVIG